MFSVDCAIYDANMKKAKKDKVEVRDFDVKDLKAKIAQKENQVKELYLDFKKGSGKKRTAREER